MTQADVYQQLTEAIGVSESVYIPKIFKMLADEDEAKILLAAAPPATVEEIAERSGVTVEKTITSISSAVAPACASAILAALTAIKEVPVFLARILLSLIPVRVVIHSSFVSTIFSMSWFESFFSGMKRPVPVMTALIQALQLSLELTEHLSGYRSL